MALGKYIKIDNELMPVPTSFSYKYEADENVYKSEAGTEMSNIRRLTRLSFAASFPCSDILKDKLVTKCQSASVAVQLFGADAAINGRLRLGGDISLVENSELNDGTLGLWVVPVTFEGE